MAEQKNEYEKPKVTLLGTMARPFLATFRAFADGVRWFKARPSELIPDQENWKVKERNRKRK